MAPSERKKCRNIVVRNYPRTPKRLQNKHLDRFKAMRSPRLPILSVGSRELGQREFFSGIFPSRLSKQQFIFSDIVTIKVMLLKISLLLKIRMNEDYKLCKVNTTPAGHHLFACPAKMADICNMKHNTCFVEDLSILYFFVYR